MDCPSASCEAAWLATGRKLLHPLAPRLATDAACATPPRQSGFNELLAVRYWVGHFQGILEVLQSFPKVFAARTVDEQAETP